MLMVSLIVAMQIGLMMVWHFGVDFFSDDIEIFLYIFNWIWVIWAVTVCILLVQFMKKKFYGGK
jgi:predicted neutral ceramidase superfamily lipid hydrolase